MRSSFRLLPLSNFLIGPQVTDMVHQASEHARDAASLRSQQAPASGSQGPFSARGGGSGSGGLAGGVVGPLSVSGPGYLTLPSGRLSQRAGQLAGAGPRPFPPNDPSPALFSQC